MIFNPPAVTALREIRLLSKTECAKRAEITVSYQSELEAGNRMNPSLDVIRRLAETLDVDADAFFVPRWVVRKHVRANPGPIAEMMTGRDAEPAAAS